ncbi:hypothetical protein QJS10_CPA08g01855 [Acorus calamus]|uniref:Uncharacterized protein n=1 Tax=Acorus calamus TaxID=4465 RepID=A0AAV9ED73_ACOCL|nr:hypothetical protein QJS10_CPA08g01855 [Acorus calamus]
MSAKISFDPFNSNIDIDLQEIREIKNMSSGSVEELLDVDRNSFFRAPFGWLDTKKI